MQVRKTINFARIYDQITKYGNLIRELAKEYGFEEQEFIERMKMGLDPKLFSKAIKANERNMKKERKNSSKETEKITDINKQEKENMAKRNEKRTEQSYRQSNNDRNTPKEKNTSDISEMSSLENKKVSITREFSNKEKELKEATQILDIHEQAVNETQEVFDKVSKALEESKKERDKAKEIVHFHIQSLEKIEAKLVDIERQIKELKNKEVYLVAPGYTGKKPEFGTYYSTEKVQGYEELSVVKTSEEYAIEPEFMDMVIAGYDSIKEYMEGLRFVILCAEYTFKDIEYTVLIEDERLKKLLQKHID